MVAEYVCHCANGFPSLPVIFSLINLQVQQQIDPGVKETGEVAVLIGLDSVPEQVCETT